MRHRTSGRKLGVPTHRRKAILRQLVEALFLHGRIRTTITRAKEIRPLAERIITWAKKGTLHHRRLAMAVIPRQDVVNRIFDHMVEWYRERAGGYTRIVKIGPRPGDAAPMAFIELVDWIVGEKLPGQLTKVVRVAEGEESKEAKTEKAKKETGKKKKTEKEKVKPKSTKPKSAADTEKEKKIAERKAEKERSKKEKAAQREKIRKEKLEIKPSPQSVEGKLGHKKAIPQHRAAGKKSQGHKRST